MKYSLFSKPAAVLAALLLSVGTFTVQSCNNSADVKPVAPVTASSNAVSPDEREAIITANQKQLQNIQRVIALGLLDPSVSPKFVAVVNSQADATAASDPDRDWGTSLASLNAQYPSLAPEMKASLLAHGGNEADAALLDASLYGFNIKGVDFTTNVRLSYKDGMYPVAPVHVVATSQLYAQSAIPAWTFTAGRYEASTVGLHTLNGQQTWTVNLLLKDGSESKVLYTSEGEPQNMESGSCRRSRVTGLCWAGGEARRCTCARSEVSYPSAL